ncbi:ABC transporter permease [Cytobacillus suaedae]|nr:ABC transporter permease [Cytobacillus suaedae]
MKFKDQFQFVRQNMKKNKTRIFMTILATAMGCTFLIVLASVGFGLHKSIVKDVTEQRMVTQIDIYGKEEPEKGYRQISDQDIDYFENIENVKAVTRRTTLQQSGAYEIDGYKTDAQALVAHMPSELAAGFELSEGRLPESDNEIVVGYDFVQFLTPNDLSPEEVFDETGKVKEEYKYPNSLLGKEVQLTVFQNIEGKEVQEVFPLTVVGVGVNPTREWALDRNVFISEAMLTKIEEFTGTPNGMVNPPDGSGIPAPVFSEERSYDEVKIYAKNMEAIEGITEQLEAKHYGAYSVVSELKQVNMLFNIMKAGLIFIGTIAIIIASIGIYNTMTMAVTERAPDIGIMKAIGASPSVIKRIFLIESSYIGLLGALFGTMVAYGISYIVNLALPMILGSVFDENPPEGLMFSYIPWSLPLICVGICLFVTILSGMRPAQRATNVDVLKAMRREV